MVRLILFHGSSKIVFGMFLGVKVITRGYSKRIMLEHYSSLSTLIYLLNIW